MTKWKIPIHFKLGFDVWWYQTYRAITFQQFRRFGIAKRLMKPKHMTNAKYPFILNRDLTFGGTKPTVISIICRFGIAKRF